MKARRVENAQPDCRPFSGRHRAELAERLGKRLPEIEEAVLARVRSVEDPSAVDDPEYVRGLLGAVRSALEHAIAILGGGARATDPLPAELTAQSRLAARSAVPLDTVLLRYLAGHALLCDFLLQDAGASPDELRQVLRAQTASLERILAAVTDAYRQELDDRHRSGERRRTEQVRRLLAGEPQDAPELRYELGLWHIGLLATGADAPRALRELATALDRVLLMARPGGQQVWGWLGGRSRLEAGEAEARLRTASPQGLTVAIGEPGRGVSGWRLTHRQARAALPVALRGQSRIVSYREVALLAAALGDEVLTASLTELYLAPLAVERDGGTALRETLRAYFAAGRNVSSAAAAMGVSRQTATSRINAIEARIGRPLEACGTEVETALALWELNQGALAQS